MTAIEPAWRRLHLIQGDYAVSHDENVVLSTILGSCVAACMFDPMARVGGMNHFLLPDDGARTCSHNVLLGVHLMELLVNSLMQAGARRDRLKVKLFGGARLFAGLTDVGGRNADFAERFVNTEGFKYMGGSLRGTQGRRVQFWPVTGRARQSVVARDRIPAVPSNSPDAPKRGASGSLELF